MITALGRQRQKHQGLKVIPGYMSSLEVSLAYMRPCLQFFLKKSISFYLLSEDIRKFIMYKSDDISIV